MNYIIKEGFRKNRYFDEAKFFSEDLFNNVNIEQEDNEISKELKHHIESQFESKIDFFLSKGNTLTIVGNKRNYAIEGFGILIYKFRGEKEISINYEGNSAFREIYLIEEGSKITINSFLKANFSYVNRTFIVGKDVELKINTGVLSKNFSEVINVINMHDNSKVFDRIALLSNKGESRLYSKLNHMGKNTKGDSFSKAVLRDKAKSSLEGMIKIFKEGKDTNSYLNQHVLLFEDAESYAFPALEIENNEVRASHSASVSEINEEDLFYLMNRGIEKKEAEKMIIEGFLGDMFDLEKYSLNL